MPRRSPDGSTPNWTALCETAASQGGYFTAAQAKASGYSLQLLQHYLRTGRVEREARGIYRLAYYPRGENDDLVLAWLWSDLEGVVSHGTALALYQLSDLLPSRRHLTVPGRWRRRRLKVPPGIVLHYGLPPEEGMGWYGCLPVTTPLQTFRDCRAAHLSPDLLEQVRRQGIARGLFTEEDCSREASRRAALDELAALTQEAGGYPELA